MISLKNNPWRVWYKYPDNGKSKDLKYFSKNEDKEHQNSHDGDFLWKAEFTYKHKNQSSNE